MAELVIANQAVTGVRMAEDALENAVREHAGLVYRIAYSVLRDHHEAEDATQETFIRVLRYRKKLDGIRDLRSWVARIAWRVATERRTRRSEVAFEASGDAVAQLRSSFIGAEEILLGTEMLSILERLIAGLPPKLRDPLTLSTVEEMSPADVATILGINEAAVRSRLFRARHVLKLKLSALLEGRHES